jgi:hypothetical protein
MRFGNIRIRTKFGMVFAAILLVYRRRVCTDFQCPSMVHRADGRTSTTQGLVAVDN